MQENNWLKILIPHLALLGANIFYAINYTVAKWAMPDYILPNGFILLRVVSASMLFWLVSAFLGTEKIDKSDYLRFIACGLFGVAGNQLLFFKGLSLTTPISASVIMTTNPVLVLIVASIILKEKLSWFKIAGIAVALTGAVTLILNNANNALVEGQSSMLGNLYIFLNACSYGVYLVLVVPLMRKYKPLTVLKWVFTIGLIVVIPFGWQEFAAVEWTQLPTKAAWSMVYVVVGTTFLAYLLNIYAIKKVSPTVVSSYIYLQPVLASVFALILGADQLTMILILCASLIFSGVAMVSKKRSVKS